MGKIMDMIYANSQCASVYFQMFDMNNVRQSNNKIKNQLLDSINSPYSNQRQSEDFKSAQPSSKGKISRKMTERGLFDKQIGNPNIVGEYMYVEMAHYTDDDTVVLICVTNFNNFEVTEYKLEK
jgi:hypothetical protein